MGMQSNESGKQIRITEEDLHPHLKARMLQRGVAPQEIERTLNNGWNASDAKPGVLGKVMVFAYHEKWEGRYYEEKEVTVYYKTADDHIILLTVKARYGNDFPRGEQR